MSRYNQRNEKNPATAGEGMPWPYAPEKDSSERGLFRATAKRLDSSSYAVLCLAGRVLI